MAKSLVVGSCETYSGKSAVILGIAQKLQQRGLEIGYGKPMSTCFLPPDGGLDEDTRFIANTLKLSESRLLPSLLCLQPDVIRARIVQADQTNYLEILKTQTANAEGDLVLLEGPGTLDEGTLFGLSLASMAAAIDAKVILVSRFHSELVVDGILMAQTQLGDRLAGILMNDVPAGSLKTVEADIRPFLEAKGIPVLGVVPHNEILRSVSVAELVRQLDAKVLCCPERLDLLVESLKIGAMNVNSALKYFRKARNMAVVTGGDRTDLQLAALETSTHCLILTGQVPPTAAILAKAKELEIPILSVECDTLSTVEIIDRAFGHTHLREPAKVATMQHLLEGRLDCDRLLSLLDVRTPATAS